ncbi:hypothetical protein [Sporosarcina sp. FSL K6-1508]|uniref:hypothetical protein n=1 Tax=Sporosarcina sp. FSL K6-1508 TaxID=2921553 RepID=UPI0030F7EC43
MTIVDLSEHVLREKVPGDSKALLLNVITAQEDLIHAQNEAMCSLLNETMEQEAIINELMKKKSDD